MGCQTKTLKMIALTVLLSSCSGFKSEPESPDLWSTLSTKPIWFAEEPKFKSVDEEGNIEPHLFFDTEPRINDSDKTLYFIATTPSGSRTAYDYDVVSGHRFGRTLYCDQSDSWGKYRGTIYTPPYTEGLVPRMLDQLGKPQKIVVFGNDEFYREGHVQASHQVRVVGGVVEQVCHEGSCLGRNNWDSRMVLVAVDFHDPRFRDVTNIDELKDRTDWDYFKAFIQNSLGRNSAGETDVPAVRVTGEIKPGFALKFSTSFSHIFTMAELRKIRSSCIKLYDYAWENFGTLKASQKEATTIDELKAKIKEQDKLKNSGVKTYGKEFKAFHAKYGKEFLTCTDFVKYSGISENVEKHWFIGQIAGFYKLERLGHYFNCNQRLWQENPYLPNSNRREFDSYSQIQKCTDEDLDMAMSQMMTYMNSLRLSGKEFYRYVEYDDTSFGTHQKLYSWVNVEAKTMGCLDPKISKKLVQFSVFPDDVKWINRSNINEKKKFGIIY